MFHQPNKFFAPLAAVTLGLLLPLSGFASTWGSKPTWSASDSKKESNSGESRRATLARDYLSEQISPFSPGSHNVALDVGQIFLFGELGDKYADSIGAQVHYTYGVSDLFALDANASYSSHDDGKYSLATVLSGMRLNLSWYDKVIPYVVFGLGFYKPSIQVGLKDTISPVVFGIHAGPGVNLELSKQVFFGASLIFHDIFGTKKPHPADPTNVLKRINVDGTYTSLLLSVGLSF